MPNDARRNGTVGTVARNIQPNPQMKTVDEILAAIRTPLDQHNGATSSSVVAAINGYVLSADDATITDVVDKLAHDDTLVLLAMLETAAQCCAMLALVVSERHDETCDKKHHAPNALLAVAERYGKGPKLVS